MSDVTPASANPAGGLGVAQSRSPLERAAILMLALGEEDASRVLRCLDSQGVHKLGRAMTQLSDIKRADVAHVLELFLAEVGDESSIPLDSSTYLKRMLIEAIGEDQAMEVLDRIFGENTNGLDKLKWLDARTIGDFLSTEHPQIQSIIVSHLEPEHAAAVLAHLPNDQARSDLLMRVATLDSLSPNAMRELNDVIEQELVGMASARFMSFGGKKVAAEILNNLDSRVEEQVMSNIKDSNELLGQEIEDLMFVFVDLAELDDRSVQTLLRETGSEALKLALKGAEPRVKDKITSNMSKRAAELLEDDMEQMGPVRLSDVESAQREILQVAKQLADSGEIVLGGSSAEPMV